LAIASISARSRSLAPPFSATAWAIAAKAGATASGIIG
jgi:hypothetical protein